MSIPCEGPMMYDESPEPTDLGHMEDHDILIWAQTTQGGLRAALCEVLILRKKLRKRKAVDNQLQQS
jgi:hypothetical protein